MSGYDLIVKNGVVVDGSGAPPFRRDLGIVGDAIVKVGDLSGCVAEEVVDADGLVVAPGFIDIHNHSDGDVFLLPTADNYVTQGVTTIVVGNCGYSLAPLTEKNREFIELSEAELVKELGRFSWRSFGEYLESLDKLKKSLNVATLVGHGTVRSAVLGTESVRPSERQLNEMKELVAEALEYGAFGMSSGLIYVPGIFSETSELVEPAKTVAKYGGVYSTHMRNEGVGLIDAVVEALEVALRSGVSLEISHVKAAGTPAWGGVARVLSIIEEYSGRGYDVSADAYPYAASSTGLEALLPSWIRNGGLEKMVRRLSDPGTLEVLQEELNKHGIPEEGHTDWDRIRISYSSSHPNVLGKSIDEVSRMWDVDPVQTIAKLLVDDRGSTRVIIHTMSEDDVSKAIAHPLVAVGSDGSIHKPGNGVPHPRSYGTFPRVIAKYVREAKILSLTEAVRKMTSLPARKIGLMDRGLVRPGFKADLVVFNYYTIKDEATYKSPCTYSSGIKYLLVNGELVVRDGELTQAKPGRLLKRLG